MILSPFQNVATGIATLGPSRALAPLCLNIRLLKVCVVLHACMHAEINSLLSHIAYELFMALFVQTSTIRTLATHHLMLKLFACLPHRQGYTAHNNIS